MLDINILKNLKAQRGVEPLKKATVNILVKMADSTHLERLKYIFSAIDRDGTGLITAYELKQGLHLADLPFDQREIDQLLAEVEISKNQKINYHEFLAATVSVKKILNEEKL